MRQASHSADTRVRFLFTAQGCSTRCTASLAIRAIVHGATAHGGIKIILAEVGYDLSP